MQNEELSLELIIPAFVRGFVYIIFLEDNFGR